MSLAISKSIGPLFSKFVKPVPGAFHGSALSMPSAHLFPLNENIEVCSKHFTMSCKGRLLSQVSYREFLAKHEDARRT